MPTALLSTIGHALGRRKQKPEIVCCFRFAAVGSVPGGARRFGSEFAQNRWPSIPVPEASQADNKEVLVGKEISELKYYSLLLTIEGEGFASAKHRLVRRGESQVLSSEWKLWRECLWFGRITGGKLLPTCFSPDVLLALIQIWFLPSNLIATVSNLYDCVCEINKK